MSSYRGICHLVLPLIIVVGQPLNVNASPGSDVNDKPARIDLFNGWGLQPTGFQISLPGDMPMQIQPTPDGRYLLVNTAGYHDHSVNVIDLTKRSVVSTVRVSRSWSGMANDTSNHTIYVSGGGPGDASQIRNIRRRSGISDNPAFEQPVLRFSFEHGTLATSPGLRLPGVTESSNHYIAGLAISKEHSLYVVDTQNDKLFERSQASHTIRVAHTKYRPYGVALSADDRRVAVSNLGGGSVTIFDAKSLCPLQTIAVGQHPSALLYDRAGRLFVANSGGNDVSVIEGGIVRERISTAISSDLPLGSTPDALAMSPDNKTLYVANGDNNDIAVVDIAEPGKSRVTGFIPTAWYPTALAVSPDGKHLYVGTGKTSSRANVPALTDSATDHGYAKVKYDFDGDISSGAVYLVDVPNAETLAKYTKDVIATIPAPDRAFSPDNIRDITDGALHKIKHVLYIIRENRTYDQVLGDVEKGNGDPKLTIFGRAVTPNAHKLVSDFVLFDNLYANGEVTEDGHEWCNGAYANDFIERAWPNGYSGRGQPDGDSRLTASPGGYIWDLAKAHGLRFRSYGETNDYMTDAFSKEKVAPYKTLEAHLSQEWQAFPKTHDFMRADVFISDLAKAKQDSDWPEFVVMHLGEDHTQGLKAGEYTPNASLASNDLAIGKIVDAVSHSPLWKSSAIFVIEDDPQGGPDHVDSHRTVGLVISPYIKRHFVDSSHYTQASLVRTMEIILGLPPMTQYDALAVPMFQAFTTEANLEPYKVEAESVDLEGRNPAGGPGALRSSKLDFSAYDRADPKVLNEILWQAAKPGIPMPKSPDDNPGVSESAGKRPRRR